MIGGGISIKGSYHEINQDYFLCKSYKDGYIMVVSDGMGSKKLSHYGSKAICESVYDVISNLNIDINIISFKDVLYFCHEKWKRELEKYYDITQCYATVLLLVVMDNKIKAARLGDGFLAICVDKKIFCLYDKKENSFVNETECLREVFDREKVEVLEIEFETFFGAVSCSDGVEIGTMQENEIKSFTQEFIDEYSSKEKKYIEEDITSWLSDWPGCDDKTLAYMIKENS